MPPALPQTRHQTRHQTLPQSLPPASQPEQALAAVLALRLMADRLELKAVQAALDQGWTWSDVAQALGVSKQAAHRRLSGLVKTP